MRIALGILAAVSAVHLGAQLLDHAPTVDATQVMLMPAAAAVLVSGIRAPRGRLVRLGLVALAFSWLGDTAPRLVDGDAAFLAMVGFFLVAQLVYAVAFWPYRHRSVLRRPRLLAPYLLAAVVIAGLCAPGAGALLPAVLVYATAIVAMAVLATGLGRLAAIGAAVFVLSDSLIALSSFGVLTLPGQGFWVMATYIAAQLMLVLAIRKAAAPSTSAPGASASSTPAPGASASSTPE